ncbi:MAG: GNAT family N-acetyltransferase [Candidatus Zixiibacteriota bacterium]
MSLTFRTDYWDDAQAKSAFIRFLHHIHRLDLTLWDKLGSWDHNYRPFSYFDGNTIAASVCVYSMDMMVEGRRCSVAQISGVGTDEKYRRRGLSLALTERAIEWASSRHEFFYLFADADAFKLYERAGFRRVVEHKTRIPVEGCKPRGNVVKLDIENKKHLELIYQHAGKRTAVSDRLGVFNEKLFMFWCLYFLRDNIYYIADLDLLVLYKRENGLLTFCDIVGSEIPEFTSIYPYISDERDREIEFLFMVDKLKLRGSMKTIAVVENGTHLSGDFPHEGSPFIFPLTSRA